MPESQVFKRGRSNVTFNMTPMIDVTFQLIIFFMLTTQMASKDWVRLNLPDPANSVARDYKVAKAVVNVIPFSSERIKQDPSLAGLAQEYRLGVHSFPKGNIDRLVRELTQTRRERKAQESGGKGELFVVELRADRGIHYAEIEPVLQALQQARLGNMYITAKAPPQGS